MLDQKQRLLIEEIKQGNTNAEPLLIKTCEKLVRAIAGKYTTNCELKELLSNAGNHGLIIAAKRFDLTRSNFFTTYAVWWIQQEIFARLKEEQPLTHNISLDAPLAGDEQDRTLHDIIGDNRHIQQSLEEKLVHEDQKRIRALLKQLLPPKEYQVLKFRYGLKEPRPMTYKEISAKLNISKESVKQLEKKPCVD